MKKFDYENKKDILYGKGKRLIKFYSDWCGPCKAVGAVLHEIENDYPDIDFIEVNTEDSEGIELSQEFKVMNIPTLLFIKDGEIKNVLQGMQSKQTLEKELKNL